MSALAVIERLKNFNYKAPQLLRWLNVIPKWCPFDVSGDDKLSHMTSQND